MVFSSYHFLFLFLPVILTLVLWRPQFRLPFLLISSFIFYAVGEGVFLGLMLASIGGNYFLGLSLAKERRRFVMLTGLAFNLGLLGFFKYAAYFAQNIALLTPGTDEWVRHFNVHLPIGISFFTFQALSYLVDVWRGQALVEKDPVRFATYISMFPQLIAGPIVRYTDIREALQKLSPPLEMRAGFRRFALGLGKKVLLANPAGELADVVFSMDPGLQTGGLLLVGVLGYALQIYFDFSGYSDMAIGLGRVLGFRFLENFRWPYAARSMQEFWRRWHISLSTWFRDYVYVPLGGNRGPRWRTLSNLLVVFVLTGLWHGANHTFLVWGLWHGFFLMIERALRSRKPAPLTLYIGHVYVPLVVCASWVFFRADTLDHAFLIFEGIFHWHRGPQYLGVHDEVTWWQWAVMGIGIVCSLPNKWESLIITIEDRAHWLATAGCLLIFILSAVAIATQSYNPFIYFRF